jgi:hypothetical protein
MNDAISFLPVSILSFDIMMWNIQPMASVLICLLFFQQDAQF